MSRKKNSFSKRLKVYYLYRKLLSRISGEKTDVDSIAKDFVMRERRKGNL